MEITAVQAIWLFFGSIALLGAFPVILETFYENKPSKWENLQPVKVATFHAPAYYIEESAEDQEIEEFISRATKAEIKPVLPTATSDIPVFSADVPLLQKSQHSIPTDDMLANVDLLLAQTQSHDVEEDYSQYFQFKNEIVDFERENIMHEGLLIQDSPLSLNDYQAIERKYSRKVADMITATPSSSFVPGVVTMIGRVSVNEDNVYLKYDGELVKMIGNNLPKYNNEIVMLSGHYVEPETFFVQGWEDPEVIQHGYGNDVIQAVI